MINTAKFGTVPAVLERAITVESAGEPVVFDGTTVEREGATWYRFRTISSMPLDGLARLLGDGSLAIEEDDTGGE